MNSLLSPTVFLFSCPPYSVLSLPARQPRLVQRYKDINPAVGLSAKFLIPNVFAWCIGMQVWGNIWPSFFVVIAEDIRYKTVLKSVGVPRPLVVLCEQYLSLRTRHWRATLENRHGLFHGVLRTIPGCLSNIPRTYLVHMNIYLDHATW